MLYVSVCRVGVVIQDTIQTFRTYLADLQKMKGYTSDEKGEFCYFLAALLQYFYYRS